MCLFPLPPAPRCTFSSNTAASAGAVALVQLQEGGRVADCAFANNTGLPTPEAAAARVTAADCGREGQGGGGALCIDLAAAVAVANTTFDANTALAGGALHVQRRCPAGSGPGACGQAALQGCACRGNRAVRGGGGCVFRERHDLLAVTCSGAVGELEAGALAAGCRCGGGRGEGGRAVPGGAGFRCCCLLHLAYRMPLRANMPCIVTMTHSQGPSTFLLPPSPSLPPSQRLVQQQRGLRPSGRHHRLRAAAGLAAPCGGLPLQRPAAHHRAHEGLPQPDHRG